MDAGEVARDFTNLIEDRPGTFDEMAAAVFSFQSARNEVYSRYCAALGGAAGDMPFLPVEAFKQGPVTSFPPGRAEHVFESSGTGQGPPSRHYVFDLKVYERAVAAHFESVFGSGPFIMLAHLPRYVERGRRSSLLYMVEYLMERYGESNRTDSFFLDDREPLHRAITHSRDFGRSLILFGAAFGLLDLVENHSVAMPADAIVVETGGMKTFRREMRRRELHDRLADGFHLDPYRIWSEYGMCELMSQCYTRGGDTFYPPPWMRFKILDRENPARETAEGEAGALALFDLANVYTVSPILTQDRAVRRGDGFEVLGRLSGAELRGCNFLLEHV